MWVKRLSSDEKLIITAACERFIADVLKPRFIASQPNRLDHPRPAEMATPRRICGVPSRRRRASNFISVCVRLPGGGTRQSHQASSIQADTREVFRLAFSG
ncbi:hypothetical protein [Mesorhizobium sp. ES1-6]|uniref:hypothetical protein n=1 Tax=Mesorhizobium sp. ES1-6 TaxID=2876626 RepID=UPI001CC9E836|nr:hypothetical protein [Mesorhizobium sp. ES1-6]MBZ9802839.1 hypothetical protein [Mesorhizobium sp. ES1-6]